MAKTKKTVSTPVMVDKFNAIKMALDSNILLFNLPSIPAKSIATATEMCQAGIRIIDELVPAIEEGGFEPGVEELYRLLLYEIKRSRVVILDPNRIRDGAPVIYSAFHPDFCLGLDRLDLGRDAIIIEIKKEQWPPSKRKKHSQKESVGTVADNILTMTTEVFLSYLLNLKLILNANTLFLKITSPKKNELQEYAILSQNGIILLDKIFSVLKSGGIIPNRGSLLKIINRAILNKHIVIRDPWRKRSGEPVVYEYQKPEFSFDLSEMDTQRDAIIIKLRKSTRTKFGRGTIPSDDLI